MLVSNNRRYDVECPHSSDADAVLQQSVLQQSALHQAARPLHQTALAKHVVVVLHPHVHTVAYTAKVVAYTALVLILQQGGEAGEDSRCESHDSYCAGWWL